MTRKQIFFAAPTIFYILYYAAKYFTFVMEKLEPITDSLIEYLFY